MSDCNINEKVAKHDVVLTNLKEDISEIKSSMKELTKEFQIFVKESLQKSDKDLSDLRKKQEELNNRISRLEVSVERLNSYFVWGIRGVISGSILIILSGIGYLIQHFVIK